jgi:hypothetical protein
MPQVGFESTISLFERAKTVHAVDRVATVIGQRRTWKQKITRIKRSYVLHTAQFVIFASGLNIIRQILDIKTKCDDYIL